MVLGYGHIKTPLERVCERVLAKATHPLRNEQKDGGNRVRMHSVRLRVLGHLALDLGNVLLHGVLLGGACHSSISKHILAVRAKRAVCLTQGGTHP